MSAISSLRGRSRNGSKVAGCAFAVGWRSARGRRSRQAARSRSNLPNADGRFVGISRPSYGALLVASALLLAGCSSSLLTGGIPPASLPQAPKVAQQAPSGAAEREHRRILAAYNGAYEDAKLEAMV